MGNSGDASPVFVVGCPRSGTTLLYHLLVSCGKFANYRAETHFFDLFLPRFGSPRSPRNRRRLADAWLGSPYHLRTGLPMEPIRAQLLRCGRTAGDFLGIIMGSTAQAQGRLRWADSTPAHLHHMREIRETLPGAKFIHMIRDGRDVALSLAPRGWTRSLPWDRGDPLLAAAWAWEWHVRRGRRIGRRLKDAYTEVRFESLVRNPQETLTGLTPFLGIELDTSSLDAGGVGSVSRPNTTFDEPTTGRFDPVGRWCRTMSAETLERIELTIGPTLTALGYEVRHTELPPSNLGLRHRLATLHRGLKQEMKERTALGRLLLDPLAAAPPGDFPDET